jgi:hypothetical protein
MLLENLDSVSSSDYNWSSISHLAFNSQLGVANNTDKGWNTAEDRIKAPINGPKAGLSNRWEATRNFQFLKPSE